MKKIALCLAVLFLLLSGCTTPQQKPAASEQVTLPTLSLSVSDTPEVSDATATSEQLAEGSALRPNLHHTEQQVETSVSAKNAVVAIAEGKEGSKRRPTEDCLWSFQLPVDGAFTFGEVAPLTLSAVAEADGTVTVRFPSENCYVLRGNLQKKAESVSLSFDETLYVAVKDGEDEAIYAIWLEHNE